MNRDSIDLEEILGVDPDRIESGVRKHLERYVKRREEQLSELRMRALEAEEEATVLRRRVSTLEDELATVTEREHEGVDIEPSTVLSTFGEALESERFADTGFAVSDISVDLRANVVHTDEGIRLNLPRPGTGIDAEALSDVRFSVRSEPGLAELDYEEVPDLIGLEHERATEAIAEAGFEVGRVDREPSDVPEGEVLDQLPSPFSLAEPGAPIDVVVAEHRAEEMADLIGRSLPDAVRFVGDRFSLEDIDRVPSDAPPGTVLDQDPEPGTDVTERDHISLTISEFRHRPEGKPEPERETESDDGPGAEEEREGEAEEAGEPTEEGESDVEDAPVAEGEDASTDEGSTGETNAERTEGGPPEGGARRGEPDSMQRRPDARGAEGREVTDIKGIGRTYGQRLRNAGIERLADLADAEPVEVADVANVSRSRAAEWIEAVHERLGDERRAEGDESHSDTPDEER